MATAEAPDGFHAYSYDRVARVYDGVAAVYSLGRIGRSRRHHVARVSPGQSVLYAGVGRGREAILAARAGARVTAVDLAPAMLSCLAKDAARAGVDIELLEGDVVTRTEGRRFDWVVAHYFLNLFEDADARRMLALLKARLGPSGRLCVADFAPSAGGGRVGRGITAVYYAPLNAVAAASGFCARHPIPDCAAWLRAAGLEVEDVTRFPVLGAADPAFWTVIGRVSS